MALSVQGQSIDGIDDIPVLDGHDHFLYIAEDGSPLTDSTFNNRFLDASSKLDGDAVLVITNVPVYDYFASDFYTINKFNADRGIIFLINRATNTRTIVGFGDIKEKQAWAHGRIEKFMKDTASHTWGEYYKFLADSVASVIGDVNMHLYVDELVSGSEGSGVSKVNNWEPYIIANRTPSDPKVHKSFLENQLSHEQLQLALKTPYVDTSMKVYDAAGLLTKDELTEVREHAHYFVDKYNFDMVIVTINQNNKRPGDGNIATENYAMDFYEYNDFGKGAQTKEGYDGVILVIDMENRKFSILDVGTPHELWHIGVNNVDRYIKNMASHLTAKDYCKAIKMFIDMYAEDCDYFFALSDDNWAKYEITPSDEIDPSDETPRVDTTVKLYDAAGILSDNEVAQLKKKIKGFIDRNKMDMVVVIINHNPIKTDDAYLSVGKFSSQFYNKNNFGKSYQIQASSDGVILVIDRLNRTFYVTDFGVPGLKWHVASSNRYKYNEILSRSYEKDRCFSAIDRFITEYEIDYQDEITFPWKKCLAFSIIIALILLIKERKKYRNVFYATTASNYVEKGSFKLVKNETTLISTHTTRTEIPKPTYTSYSSSSGSSYRSSGSSHRSSSGRSFGGGSGSF